MLERAGHIGILVKNMEETLEKACRAFAHLMPRIHDNREKKMRVASLFVGGLEFEFIEDYGDGAFAKIVREKGPTIHHVAFHSHEVEKDIAMLLSRGVEMADTTPRLSALGKKLAFAKPEALGGITFEVCEP